MSNTSSDSIIMVGLSQMKCVPNLKTNLKNQLRLTGEAAKGGAKIICTQELFASQYFCQVEDYRFFEYAETIPGPSTDAFCKLAKKHKVVIIASLFERRMRGSTTTPPSSSTPTVDPRAVSQDAHPRRSALSTKSSISRPATPVSALENKARQDRRADLLGPVVSRGRTPDCDAGRRNSLLSHRHRLASQGKAKPMAWRSTRRGN